MFRLVALLMAVAGCAPEPTSINAFRADLDRAERMVAACDAGRRSGPVCDNARAGAAAARRDARRRLYRLSR